MLPDSVAFWQDKEPEFAFGKFKNIVGTTPGFYIVHICYMLEDVGRFSSIPRLSVDGTFIPKTLL